MVRFYLSIIFLTLSADFVIRDEGVFRGMMIQGSVTSNEGVHLFYLTFLSNMGLKSYFIAVIRFSGRLRLQKWG